MARTPDRPDAELDDWAGSGADERGTDEPGAAGSGAAGSGAAGRAAAGATHAPEREARRLALGAVFEADFGQRTPERVLARRLEEADATGRTAEHAVRLVNAVVLHRDSIDARIERMAPAYRVVQMARIDRALLRCGMGELLHCPTTPARVAIAEWVELARTYSGEPVRRLMNGVLGQVVKDTTGTADSRNDARASGPGGGTADVNGHVEGA